MKRIIILLLLVGSFSFNSSAQVHKGTIGIRLPYGYYFGPEVSYQLGISERNRFEFDAGFLYNGGAWNGSIGQHYRLALTVMFHWDFNLFDGLNFFVGPGVQAGPVLDPNGSPFFFVAIGGQIGVEYDFSHRWSNVPLVVALDHRPLFDVYWPGNRAYDGHIAASARYIFKN